MPKAAKADIWRLAVILRYGGIYVDSDVKALHPFREYLWPNASAASGMGRNKDFHQWCEAAGVDNSRSRCSQPVVHWGCLPEADSQAMHRQTQPEQTVGEQGVCAACCMAHPFIT